MYQPGEMIVYGQCGVCRVVQISKRPSPTGEDKLYYQLEPVYSTEVIYTPVDTPVFMRPALTREQACALIEQIPSIPNQPYHNQNIGMLRAHYEELFRAHSCETLLELLRSIYVKNAEARRANKKPGRVEQNYRKLAEEMLHGELAVALGIAREEVPAYIQSCLEKETSV
jgi:CarD family transcriptional regulator